MYEALLFEAASPVEVSSDDVEDAPDRVDVFLGTLALMQLADVQGAGVASGSGGTHFGPSDEERVRLIGSDDAIRVQRLHL
jgi:hypothetical protein